MFSAGCSEVASDNSQSFDTMDEDNLSTNNNGNNNVSILNQTPWYKMPEMSLLDLAFKLKQAEMRIFGRDKRLTEKKDSDLGILLEDAKEIRLNSDLYLGIEPSAKRALLEINEKYRQLEASFPRNLTEEAPRLLESLSFLTEPMKFQERVKKRFGCGWCGYNTDSKSHLHRHHKSMHRDRELKILTDPDLFIAPKRSLPPEGKRKHQCDMCSYQTDCKSHLRRHQGSVHCKDKLYECPICKIEFSRSEKAKEHHFAFHPEKSFDIRNMRKPPADGDAGRPSTMDKIDKIKQLYEDADQLIKIRRPDSLFKSSRGLASNGDTSFMNSSDEQLCDESGDYNRTNEAPNDDPSWTLDNAQEEKDGTEGRRRSRRNNSFVCLKCDYSCRDLWHLRRHVLDVHSSHKEHKCKVCHYAASRHHRLFCHMLKHGELFCNFCEFCTTNPEAYKLHFQVCSVIQKMTKCSVCSMEFNDFATYKTHVTSDHKELLVTCPKCQFFTESTTELQSHLGLHVWEDKVCPICHFMADDDEGFSRHCCETHLMFDEDWSQNWICNDCGKNEPDKGLAVAHVASHAGATHACQESDCSFRCHLEQSLELHLKYMHQADTKTSVTAYIDLLDAQMLQNKSIKTEDSKPKEVGPELQDCSGEAETNETNPSEAAYPNFGPASPNEVVPAAVNPAPVTQSVGYSCPYCTERAPFRYKKSYEKHMSQHEREEEENMEVDSESK